MRTEFNNLVDLMDKYSLYHSTDEVGIALNELEQKIIEVEKRMECAIRSNKDNEVLVLKLANSFQDEGKIQEIIHYADFETMQRSVHDVDIALDLKDTECIDNDWYGLFAEPIKEEPKVLIPKDAIVVWKENVKYYNVGGGAKARVTKDYTTDDEENDKYIMVEFIDELRNGQENGGYDRDSFSDEFELPKEVIPTSLCKTPQTHEFVKDIIAKLKVIDVDGETMQYILEQVGMDEQMHRQLVLKKHFQG